VPKVKPKVAAGSVDRRYVDRRTSQDRRKQAAAVAVDRRTGQRREKVNRRRQIDPTTCERDYSINEVEFMHALDDYKRRSGRMFPTCSEILEVLISLGYRKVEAATTHNGMHAPSAEATSPGHSA
jgi:hypothetical protein